MKEELSETIEAYLANSLSVEAKRAFEARLQNEPDLAKALADEKVLSNLLLENELFSLRDQMTADFENAEKSQVFKWKIIGLLAAIAIVAAGVFIALPNEEPAIVLKKAIESQSFADDTSRKTEKAVAIASNKIANPEQATTSATSAQPKQMSKEFISDKEETVQEVIQESVKPVLVSEKKLPKTETQPESILPCAEKMLEAFLQTKASEKGEQNGSIKIQLVKEKNSDYLYSLDKAEGFSENASFEHLAKGNYHVFAKSSHGCVHSLGQTLVKETLCLKDYKKSFSPEFDPAWSIPISETEQAKVLIKDKAGTTVFETHTFSNNEISWDGNLPSGATSATGNYKVFITYLSGENCIATVTLFR